MINQALACSTDVALCWGTVAAPSFTALVEAAAMAGCPAVTVQPAMVADDLAGARRTLDRCDVGAAYVDPLLTALPGSPGPGDVAPEHGRFFAHGEDDCFRVAEAVGAETINVAHFLGRAVPVPALVDAFGGLCDRAAVRGLGLVLEFIPGTGVPDLATALTVVTGCGRPNAGVLLDTWHLARSGGDLDDVRSAPSGTLRAVQLSDRVAGPDPSAYVPMSDRLLPGEGDLPLGEIVAAARANHPAVTLSVEVFSAELRDLAPADAAGRAVRATAGVLPTA